MKIYTLGTSHGDSTVCRFNSSTAYETADGNIYLVDAGAPVEALLRRKALHIKDVRAVFVTHMHDDHAGGLSGLIKQATRYASTRNTPFTVHLPEENAIFALKGWVNALHERADHKVMEYKTVTDGAVYEDDNLTVTAIRTCHLRTKGRNEGDPCSFAYVLRFKKDNYTVLHTGDLLGNLADFPKIAFEQEFDLCLCEATHYPPELAVPIFQKAKFKKMIFIHVNDPWHNRVTVHWKFENNEKLLLSHYTSVPYPIVVAHDGDEFDTRFIR